MGKYDKIEIQHICLNICSGGTPKSTVTEYYGGNIPWLNTKEINFCRIYETERTITDEGLNNSSAKWVPANTVIVAMYGATAGKTAIAKIPLTTNQACCNLNINSAKADYRFVYYALYNDYAYLASLANGGAQQNLNAQQIKEFEIPFPPLKEQKRIADILSSLDDKIELNRRINRNLEQQAQALFKAWFVDFEPFKDGKFVDSELGKIPEGWKVQRADEIYNINIGKTPPRKENIWFSKIEDSNVKWVSISDMANCGMFIGNSSEYLTTEAVKKFNIIIVPKNTILLSFKLTIGRVSIAKKELTTNEAIARFCLSNIKLREFTYFTLKNYDYSMLGSTSSIATAVNSKIIKGMKILLPNIEVLESFHYIVKPLFDSIESNSNEMEILYNLRNTLLPRLMSGELYVNTITG